MSLQNWPSISDKTLAIIMGGGAGSRLFPLTKERAKPAVPLAGKYRLVDIPVSNCLNSGLRKIYVLTQFNSVSLHRHIHASYKFDHFSQAFVEILAAQQTPSGERWYQGTADAVRQNLRDFLNSSFEYFIILSGDQLYRMDFRDVLRQHIEKGSDLTIATIPVSRQEAPGFGIMHTDAQRRICQFVEKPKDSALLDTLRIPPTLLEELGKPADAELFQASMGIYVFNRKALVEALDNQHVDFGKHVIPGMIHHSKVSAYIFEGYWEDIGTIRSFFEANLALADSAPPFDFFDTAAPIFTHARFLPASKINSAHIQRAIISDGCVITQANVERAVIGIRSFIEPGSSVKNCVMMGADYFDSDLARPAGAPALGIGRDCVIDSAIIDKNARIGDGVVISPEGKPSSMDGENFFIRDGIVVIPKDSVIPSGTRI
ncbi:MAG: Glucose-phosphate adenylyltransferase [Verrucomicrobiota bacterium]|jgi:glucose-1-phosphate adenylyltransferase